MRPLTSIIESQSLVVWPSWYAHAVIKVCPRPGPWNKALTSDRCSKAITGLSVHCSGRLVLSTARDGGLRMWNLAKGRCQYKTRLADVALDVQFAPSGNSYALVHGSEIQICDVGGRPALHLPHTSSRWARLR